MTPEEFRAAGHELVDWIADFRATIGDRPVEAPVAPGDVRGSMSPTPPVGPGDFGSLLAEVDRVVMPGMTHAQHPRYFGFFPANVSLSSTLGDLMSTGLGALGISWQSSPALTEVEEVVCDWMRQLVGLSDAWHGTINDTASTSALVALLCARERATGSSQLRGGLQAEAAALRVYASPQSHSSVQKAALLAGYGLDNVVWVDVDGRNDLDPEALRRAIDTDIAAGRVPAAVIASVGSTTCTAIDPVAAIVEVCAPYGVWVHVDAAMAGTAMLVPELRGLWDGVEGADSISWNPHKWMGAALDCSMYLVRDVDALVGTMSTNASYLASTQDGAVTQYRDWGLPLGRRFRALKLWFQLGLDGVGSIQERVRRDLANAAWLAEVVAATPQWTVVAPVRLQTVCVRHEPAGLADDALDHHTLAWARAVNRSGAAYLTPARLDGGWMVRVSIGAESTTRADVEAVWAAMRSAAEES